MQKCNEGAMVDIGFPISIQLYLRLLDWIHLLIEDQIPLEYCFPQILWKTEFQGIYGKLNFPSIHLRWKIIFHKFYGKQNSIVVHILIDGSQFSMNFVENWIPQKSKKADFPVEFSLPGVDEFTLWHIMNKLPKKQERKKSWYYNREVKSKSLQRKTCWVEDDFLFSSDLAFYFDF